MSACVRDSLYYHAACHTFIFVDLWLFLFQCPLILRRKTFAAYGIWQGTCLICSCQMTLPIASAILSWWMNWMTGSGVVPRPNNQEICCTLKYGTVWHSTFLDCVFTFNDSTTPNIFLKYDFESCHRSQVLYTSCPFGTCTSWRGGPFAHSSAASIPGWLAGVRSMGVEFGSTSIYLSYFFDGTSDIIQY